MTVTVPPPPGPPAQAAAPPAAPGRVLVAAAAAGVAAGLVVPDAPPGLGVALLAVAVAVALARLAGPPASGWAWAQAGVALLLVAGVALRDAAWVLVLDLLAAAALGSLALRAPRTWPGVLRGLVEVPLTAPRAVPWAVRGGGRLPAPSVWPLVRGVLLTAGLLGVFGALLVSADPVFAALLEPLLPGAPDLGLLPARVVVGGLAAAALAAAALVRTAPRPEPVLPAPARRLEQRSEWALPLWSLALLLGLALLIDLSAFARLQLYSDAYGLTRLRMLATAVTLGLAVVLLLVALAGLRPGRWLPQAAALTVGVSLLALTAADPDRRIAESALERGSAADLDYLAGLSADAVPVLDRLPEPARSCVLPEQVGDPGWLSANVARARAAELLAERPPGACPTGDHPAVVRGSW